MEPLSIAGGVIGLLGTTVKVASVLNDLYRDINTANLRISGLQETVQGFITLLNMMKDTLEREEIQASLGTTGHVNNHWAHVSVTIKDGQKTLGRLQKLLEKINKSTSLLDETRKNIRLQNEAQEIGVYKSQIQQYNDNCQSTDKIIPKLDGLEQKVRQLAFTITRSMTDLHAIIESNASETQQRNEAKDRLETLKNLKETVKSAGTMVSDVATSLNNDQEGNASVFGDIFPPERSVTMKRYMAANKIREEDGEPGPSNYPRRTSTGVILGVVSEHIESDEYDSEAELEVEKFQTKLDMGKQMLDEEKYSAAEDRFMSCLKSLEKVRAEGATVACKRMSVSKPEIIRLLFEVYMSEERLEDAQSLLMEAIGADAKLVVELTSLAEAFYQSEEYPRALACGDRALRAYRKLRQVGSPEEIQTLQLLIDVCKAQGDQDEQMTFEALLSQRQNNVPRQTIRSRNKSITLTSDPRESSSSRDAGDSMARYSRKSSNLLSPSEDIERISQSQVSLITLNLPSVPSTKGFFDDQLSPWSLTTPELTDSVGSDNGARTRMTPEPYTPRISVATTMDYSNPQLQSEVGYFDPEIQSRRSRVSSALGYSTFEQEVDDIFNTSSQQKQPSFDTASFASEPRISQARQRRETDDDILPAPLRQSVRSDYGSEKEVYSTRKEKDDENRGSSHSRKSSTTPNPSLLIRQTTNLSLKSTIPESKRLYKKVVVVGDSNCGKTPLLTLMMRGTFPEHTQPTGYNVEKMDVEIQGMRMDLVVWEIGGQDKRGLSRLSSSPPPDAFLLCFSIDSPRSLAMIPSSWHKDMKKYGKKAPCILVGLKSDLRSDPRTIEALQRRGDHFCSAENGREMANQIEATQYLECSAKTGEGVHGVLEAITRLTISANDLVKEMKRKDKADEKMRKEDGEDRKSPKVKRVWDVLRRSTS